MMISIVASIFFLSLSLSFSLSLSPSLPLQILSVFKRAGKFRNGNLHDKTAMKNARYRRRRCIKLTA